VLASGVWTAVEGNLVLTVDHPPAGKPRLFTRPLVLMLGTLLVVGTVASSPEEAYAVAPTPVRTALPTGATTVSLALGLDRVVGVDDRHGPGTSTVWTRPVSASGFGPESVLSSSGTTVLVSGGRTAVVSGSATTLYDRGVAAGSIPDATVQVTGPYLRAAGGIWKSDGTKLSTVKADATSKYLVGNRLDDLQLGSAGMIEVTQSDVDGSAFYGSYYVATNAWQCSLSDSWEDQVLITCPNHDLYVTDYTGDLTITGPYTRLADTTAPVSHGLGDGYLLLKSTPQGAAAAYSLWDLQANSFTSLPECTSDPVTDGAGHIACASASDIVWMDYSALSKSAPRMLGTAGRGWMDVSADPPWSPTIDTDKALQAGTLDITTSDGKVIRTLATPPTDDGSLRGVVWDGRDTAGVLVSPGSYLFRLNASAKDGSGAVTQLNNSEKPVGSVFVLQPGWSRFIQASYQDFLGRQPSLSNLAQGSVELSRNPRTNYLTGLANSDEWLTTIITKMYQDTLGRAPDAAGLAGWTALIRNRTFTVADVASRFYSSDEYYLYHAGGTPTSWVTALYTKLLNRAPDPAGLQHWAALTSDPTFGRNKVAYEFYQSTESRMHRVLDLYQALLKRNPDPTGWPYWTTQVLTTGDITLAINLAGSQEYQLRAEARF
jgi:Domain of unknown function (DUF4214)/FlgD Ig-like domain